MWKRFFEWYLEIPPSPPGEGSTWRLSWHHPFPAAIPAWCGLLISACAIGLLIWVYRRESGELTGVRRMMLALCRFGAVATVLFSLTEVSLQIDRTGLPHLLLFVDVSASMSVSDQYPANELPAGLTGSTSGAVRELTRWEIIRAIFRREEGHWLKQLLNKYKLRVYSFSDSAVPMGKSESVEANDVTQLLTQLDDIKPQGKQTRPGPAVRQVLNDFRGLPPSAVVVLTDGISSTNDNERLSTITGLAARHFVPFYVIGVGSTEPTRDVEIFDVVLDDVTFVNDPMSITARIKSSGFKGKSAVVRVRDVKSGDVLVTQRVTFSSDDAVSQSIAINPVPDRAGEYDYAIEVVPLAGESLKENNLVVRHVSVREEKIRVLLADSRPRYEYRFVKHMLEREPSVVLHTVLQEADLEYAQEDETALAHFPVKKDELWTYDVIILGDVNPAYLSTSVYRHLQEFVGEKGGGLILIAGENYNPIEYQQTPIEVLIPFDVSQIARPPNDQVIKNGYRVEPTAAGLQGIPILRFGESDAENHAIWKQLPEFYWKFGIDQLKSGATALLIQVPDARSANAQTVIALQRFGNGKVLYHATDELWRWRLRVGDLYYGKYWVHAIRYLSRSQLLGQDRAAELNVDRSIYELGEPVELRARFIDERFLPSNNADIAVVIEHPGDVDREVILQANPAAPNTFASRLTDLPAGTYRAWISRPIFRETPPTVDFRIESPRRELLNRTLAKDDLVLTARRTRGKYYSVKDADRLPLDLPSGRAVTLESEAPIPLWNRPELMALFVSFLVVEWLLRKRFRLA
ncbi:MAG: hypothetical protein O2955_14690 [Planctomycetota bacterium]|nr:hypothetical protein [Planctomycetota bacterium]MDA1213760.1 hypothetical protein [Planctomycetota bacterium]